MRRRQKEVDAIQMARQPAPADKRVHPSDDIIHVSRPRILTAKDLRAQVRAHRSNHAFEARLSLRVAASLPSSIQSDRSTVTRE